MTWGVQASCIAIAMMLALLHLCSRMRAPLGPDEGYLWYGVQQSLRGKMPHRDFKSYEPARYLWCAAIARVLGSGLLVLRLSTHLFFAAGLSCALVVLRELQLDWLSIGFAGLALTAFAHPQHKQFEHGAILGVWAVYTHMLLDPSALTIGFAAATAGVALLLGFNLFLYFTATLVASLVLGWAAGWVEWGPWMFEVGIAGMLVGISPFVFMCADANFTRRFYERRIVSVLARGSSNLPLPLPWPWQPAPAQVRALDRPRQRAFQEIFLALFTVPVAAVALAVITPELGAVARGIVSASALGLMTSHHAASRADPSHITQVVGPLCLVVALLLEAVHPTGSLAVAAFAVWTIWPLHPERYRRRNSSGFTAHRVGGLAIHTPCSDVRLFVEAESLARESDAGPSDLLAVPVLPAVYAVLGVDSPIYDTFCVFKADDAAQQDMIDAIERVPVTSAIVADTPLDDREDLRFSHTHPRVWEHLCAAFEREVRPELGPDVHRFVRRM